MFKEAAKLNCPLYILAGRGDNQCYYTLAEEYYRKVKARKKQLVWFEQSGHTIFNTEADKLQQALIALKKKK